MDRALFDRLLKRLLTAQGPDGLWEGRLSSSALSTAVAAFALHRLDPEGHREAVMRGLAWLAAHVNADGGWGDTPRSPSNLSTTLLCWSALAASEQTGNAQPALAGAEAWIQRKAGSLTPDSISAAILDTYGKDRTFSTPILAMCAMAGRLGRGRAAWRRVPQVPFELAAFPNRFYRRLRLPMVSYALPALITMGLVRHRQARTSFPGWGRLRDRLTPGLLEKLVRLQPPGGGFLEAAPLTGFVAMSLCAAGEARHPAARRAGEFLLHTVREDGSWPIDTNLNLWLTTQAVEALAAHPAGARGILGPEAAERILNRLLETQGQTRHPYTGAAAGGWAWTSLPGGVPDADDTAGACEAMAALADETHARWPEASMAAGRGIRWLLGVQNRNGGIPTFCRGWGRLPFDRSCPDLTAHALGAMLDWRARLPGVSEREIDRSIQRMIRFLLRTQQKDGSWIPLWFGNEQARNAENRLVGTARVAPVLRRAQERHDDSPIRKSLAAALRWLAENQNTDGGWGAERGVPSSMEETGLAVHALTAADGAPEAVEQGLNWLTAHTADAEGHPPPVPIGLYFARLWYAEELYPVVFALAASSSGMSGSASARKSRTR